MYEVFNYSTGETIGYTDSEYAAKLAVSNLSNSGTCIFADYINSDTEETGVCMHGKHMGHCCPSF